MARTGSAEPDTVAHRIAGGLLLVTAPVLLVVAGIFHPAEAETAGEQLRVVRDGLGSWYAVHWLAIIGFGLLLPAMAALTRPIRAASPGLHLLAAAFLGVGIVATLAELTLDGLGLWLLAQASDLEAATPVAENLATAPEVAVLSWVAVALPVGLVVVGVGFWITRAAHAWKAIVAGLAGVALAVGFVGHLSPAVAGGFLALTAVCVATGVREIAAGRQASRTPDGPDTARVTRSTTELNGVRKTV
jgi:hypothetical protein